MTPEAMDRIINRAIWEYLLHSYSNLNLWVSFMMAYEKEDDNEQPKD